MNIVDSFKRHLVRQKHPPANVTVKNYIADVKKFITWFENTFKKPFHPQALDRESVRLFKASFAVTTSAASIDRYLSSLRKFSSFLKEAHIIRVSPFEGLEAIENKPEDPWHMQEFKNYLYLSSASRLTIKNYTIDLNQFFVWLQEVLPGNAPVLQSLSISLIEEYKTRLYREHIFSPLSINRKLSSLRKYVAWSIQQGYITNASTTTSIHNIPNDLQVDQKTTDEFLKSFGQSIQEEKKSAVEKGYSRIPFVRLFQKLSKLHIIILDMFVVVPVTAGVTSMYTLFNNFNRRKIFITDTSPVDQQYEIKPSAITNIPKSLYAPFSPSRNNFSWYRKPFHSAYEQISKWYNLHQSNPFYYYFNSIILGICITAIALGIYTKLVIDPHTKNPALAISSNSPPRILSFQGRLTDKANNPITSRTDLRFSLYNDSSATGSALLWQENQSVTPDTEGSFSTLLGNNSKIPATIFSQNASLYIGMAVGQTQELLPRQSISTVTNAENATMLQGLLPTTKAGLSNFTNTVLALDGNTTSPALTIGGSVGATFQATGGEFNIIGRGLNFLTTLGSNNNIHIIPDGSGQIDLQKPLVNSTLNNNILSAAGAVEVDDLFAVLASSSGQTAFTVVQNGSGPLFSASSGATAKFTIANDGTITSGGTAFDTNRSSFNLLNTSALAINFAGAATSLNMGAYSGTTSVNNTLQVKGNAILGTNSTQSITPNGLFNASLIPSSPSVNLGSATNPYGTLYVNTIVASSSAFSSSTSLSGSTSGNLTFTGTSPTIATTNMHPLTIGDVATGSIQLSPKGTTGLYIGGSGNIGVGTATPGYTLDVTGKIHAAGGFNGNCIDSTSFTNNGNCNQDVAEIYPASENVESGDILAIDSKSPNAAVKKTAGAYDNGIMGIVTTNPGIILGVNGSQVEMGGDTTTYMQHADPRKPAVALNGKVPVKVSSENGVIMPGDPLTASSLPGVAMKATKPGIIIGKALESYDTTNSQTIGKISVFISITWYDPQVAITNQGNLNIMKELGPNNLGQYILQDSSGDHIDLAGAFSKAFIAYLQAGLIKAEEAVLTNLTAVTASITNLTSNKIVSPIAEIDVIHTNVLSPLSPDSHIAVTLDHSRVAIHENASFTSATVAMIDNQGNASFSGQLAANGIQTNNATISGTLHAGKIFADEIVGLHNGTASAQTTINNITNIYAATPSSSPTNTHAASDSVISSTASANSPITSPTANLGPKTSFADIASYSGYLSYVPHLDEATFGATGPEQTSAGPTTFSDVGIGGTLSIGSRLVLADNTINVLGGDLQLQPLGQGGVSIAAGQVYIDNNGNLTVNGSATFNGSLAANIISPISGHDLTISLNNKSTTQSGTGSLPNLSIKNASGSGIFSINQLGDIIASGAATISKLNLSIAKPALAVSATEQVATGSAGTGQINPHQMEITIDDQLVTDKSLIYITPAGNTNGQVPYLLRQVPNKSFTAGVSLPTTTGTSFNWLIIN